MYWLLSPEEQRDLRNAVRDLVDSLSVILKSTQIDQLFPFPGRKDRRKGQAIVAGLTSEGDLVVEPFSGSGVLTYSTLLEGREVLANEWEVYSHRMSSAPWRVPEKAEVDAALDELRDAVSARMNHLYRTECPCGHSHVLDSLFFDLDPLEYYGVTQHERLGDDGENVTYRQNYKCPNCGRTQKLFDASDEQHLASLEDEDIDEIFQRQLIENSRINIPATMTTYGDFFPTRSKLVLPYLWNAIQKLDCSNACKMFLEDVFLSLIPQAKYKDYRSKSQDLHVPSKTLRETNLWHRFQEKVERLYQGLVGYGLSSDVVDVADSPIACMDFRDFMQGIASESVNLVLTDPPWMDGVAFFEKAQLYHPWLGYSLQGDTDRLQREMVVTDAPSRATSRDMESWWNDLEDFFRESARVLVNGGYLAMYYRPISPKDWLTCLNKIKHLSRQSGLEPLICIDVHSSDPSMRVQQSAAYLFSEDVVFLFRKLQPEIQRSFFEGLDIDLLCYQCAVELQEDKAGPFSYRDWRVLFADRLIESGAHPLNAPAHEATIRDAFDRYCDEITHGMFLPKPNTPFSSHLFDIPALERLFTYVPQVVARLTENGQTFSYAEFVLALSTFVENGTRRLIAQIEQLSIIGALEAYAEPLEAEGRVLFRSRETPEIPAELDSLLNLDPYEFEELVARLFHEMGFTSVSVVGRSGDRGVDIACIDPQGRQVVVQCKRYQGNVSAEPIQRLHSFSVTRGADRRILVTTSGLTPHAEEEARNTDTECITGAQLVGLIRQHLA